MSRSPRDLENEVALLRSLLRSIKSGVGIVEKTFYHNPDPQYFTKEATGTVVSTMRACIAMYENTYGELD